MDNENQEYKNNTWKTQKYEKGEDNKINEKTRKVDCR